MPCSQQVLHPYQRCDVCVLRKVWCLAVSRGGDMVATAGADRSLRVWQRTEEPFFVEEEKEKRLESLFEADLEVLNALCYIHPPCS